MRKINTYLLVFSLILLAIIAIISKYKLLNGQNIVFFVDNQLSEPTSFDNQYLNKIIPLEYSTSDMLITYNKSNKKYEGIFIEDKVSYLNDEDEIVTYGESGETKEEFASEITGLAIDETVELSDEDFIYSEDLSSDYNETKKVFDKMIATLDNGGKKYDKIENHYWQDLAGKLGVGGYYNTIDKDVIHKILEEYRNNSGYVTELILENLITISPVNLECDNYLVEENEESYCRYNLTDLQEKNINMYNNMFMQFDQSVEGIQKTIQREQKFDETYKISENQTAKSEYFYITGDYYYEVTNGEKLSTLPSELNLKAFDSDDGDISEQIILTDSDNFKGDGTDGIGTYYLIYNVENSKFEVTDFTITIDVK